MTPMLFCQNFFDFRMRYTKYHNYFGFCEFLNVLMVLLSMFITDALLLNNFFGYGAGSPKLHLVRETHRT